MAGLEVKRFDSPDETRPIAGPESCEALRLGYVISGRILDFTGFESYAKRS